jgi:hypothetical protein
MEERFFFLSRSMSAAHIDWHENPLFGLQVCAVLDDSSEMIIAVKIGLLQYRKHD